MSKELEHKIGEPVISNNGIFGIIVEAKQKITDVQYYKIVFCNGYSGDFGTKAVKAMKERVYARQAKA